MDELTELRQQVSALQLQNTQLMVRLVCLSLLLVGGFLVWNAFTTPVSTYSSAEVAQFALTDPLTPIPQGLLRDQAPCPQAGSDDDEAVKSTAQGSYTVGVMVLGASGTFLSSNSTWKRIHRLQKFFSPIIDSFSLFISI